MSRLNEIHNYYLSIGVEEETLIKYESTSVYLSLLIAKYAHKDQTRDNGENYIVHPMGCLEKYRRLVGISDEEPFNFDADLLYECSIPYDGVQEVCLLHDVIEDTNFTIEDIEEIFEERELGLYYRLYIRKPLTLITHDKSVPYTEYIYECMSHPTSALVKMIDLSDNSNPITLSEYNQNNYDRCVRYLTFIYMINNAYHFIENAKKYKDKLIKTTSEVN